TGEARLAPFSGSAVLNSVPTSLNSSGVAPGGSTLPTVIVVAPAPAAVSSAQAEASAATANVSRFLRIVISLRRASPFSGRRLCPWLSTDTNPGAQGELRHS